MTNMLDTIIPKSDQLNADDLIGGVMKTIKITAVSRAREPEQPISIGFEGDAGKPWKPCKSMRRVLVNVWGPDGNTYTGRSVELYRDDTVLWGGMAVGGIRISRMSHMEKPMTMALTESKTKRRPFTVQPLTETKTNGRKAPTPREVADGLVERFKATADIDAHNALVSDDLAARQTAWLLDKHPGLHTEVANAMQASITRHTGETDGETDDATSTIETGDGTLDL